MTKETPTHISWLVGLLALSLGLAACGDSASDTDTDAEIDRTTSTSDGTETSQSADNSKDSALARLTDEDPADDIALFTISDSDDIAFTVSSCTGAGESTVAFEGQSDAGTVVIVDATDMVGGVSIDGPEGSFEGTIDVVSVGDTGWTTVSGTASEADHTSTGGLMKFSISGFVCS